MAVHPIPSSSSSRWMNDELPSPPKLCTNNTMAPIPQSLIRGSSLVASPECKGGTCERAAQRESETQRIVLILDFSEYPQSDTVFCFVSRKRVAEEMIFSLFKVSLHTALVNASLRKQKPFFCSVCRSHLQFWLLVFFPPTDPFPGGRVRRWTAAEMNQNDWELYCFCPTFSPPSSSISDQIRSQFWHKRDTKGTKADMLDEYVLTGRQIVVEIWGLEESRKH